MDITRPSVHPHLLVDGARDEALGRYGRQAREQPDEYDKDGRDSFTGVA